MVRMSESSFLSSDGKSSLYCCEYLPEGNPAGIVQIVHGLGEYSARYDHFARFLADNGFIVVLHDQLGHGRSISGPDTEDYFADENGWDITVQDIRILHNLTAAKYPGKPYFLIGHSMGSFQVRTFLIRYRTGIDGAVISGTGQQNPALIRSGKLMASLEIRRHGAHYRSPLLLGMAFGSYNKKIEDPRTDYDWLSRNPDVVDAYVADPLTKFDTTAGLIRDMMDGIAFISSAKNVARMKKDLPVMFLSGDCDPVGDYGKGVIRSYKSFLKAGMTDVTMKLYHGGRHEMLNEINKDEVYQDILGWINVKIGR